MDLLSQIKACGIVGCGGAGFPTHVKLGCRAEYLIVNGAECEPLLWTDRWIMIHYADKVVAAAVMAGELVGAKQVFIAIKESYEREAESLISAIGRLGAAVSLFKMRSFYPAGDEQVLVADITGRVVPPSGIPLDVGVVVSNVATLHAVHDAAAGIPLTHKYLTVIGAVKKPSVVLAPVGTSFHECIAAAGGAAVNNWLAISGGPLMGSLLTQAECDTQVVSKTTSGIIVLPDDAAMAAQRQTPIHAVLRRAKSVCIQCSYCTEMCPRYLLGHPLKPHKIMRKLAYAPDIASCIDDPDVRQSLICSECGVCEAYACPMGLMPRRVNALLKAELAKSGIRYEKPDCSPQLREERQFRRVSTKRIAGRMGLSMYYDVQPDELVSIEPDKIRIPLKQHIGVPCVPVVAAGDRVSRSQIVGMCPSDALGAHIHTGIDGIVRRVGSHIEIERMRG